MKMITHNVFKYSRRSSQHPNLMKVSIVWASSEFRCFERKLVARENVRSSTEVLSLEPRYRIMPIEDNIGKRELLATQNLYRHWHSGTFSRIIFAWT